MIRPRYAFKLARTKLHSKRGVLLASIIVASLLFAALIACVIVFTASEKSATEFVKKAGNDRYLVKVQPVSPLDKVNFPLDLSLEEVREIRAFEARYHDDQRKKAKALEVTYDESSTAQALVPAAWKPNDLPEEQRVSINMQSPVIDALISQKVKEYTATATNKYTDLRRLGDTYGASGYYAQYNSDLPSIPQSRLIIHDKEDFGATMIQGDFSMHDSLVNSIYNSSYEFQDVALLDRYLLTKDAADLRGIPVIVTAQEAATLFGKNVGIDEEPDEPAAKRAWLETVQQELSGHTYDVCYRNDTEQAMLNKIQQDYAEIRGNTGTREYVEPSLQYDYPKIACGDIVVKKDARSTEEKQTEKKQQDAQKALGTHTEPQHKRLTFQIVGFINAERNAETVTNAEDYVKNLLSNSGVTMSSVIPLQLYESLPNNLKDDIIKTTDKAVLAKKQEFATRILEFSSIEQARTFMKNESCPEYELNCERQYHAAAYGSNYLILDDISKLFQRIVSITLPVVLVLALVIMWFTISRIMADNRKETAVYRAMGAKRRDVVGIYATYIFTVALCIATFSLILGVGIAFAIDHIYGPQLTNIAANAFGMSSNDSMKFSLFNLSSPMIWGVVGVIFLVSFLASLQPLIRNTFRAPIRDMRED